MTVATNNHILIDDKGVARIDGSRMKVIHLVKAMIANTATPERLREAFPHLSLAQIHAALAYYYDHQEQLDAQIKQDTQDYAAEKASVPPSPFHQKLRNSGHRP